MENNNLEESQESQEAHRIALEDTYNMIESWAEQNLSTAETLFASLTILFKACIDNSPSKLAMLGMINACLGEALDQCHKKDNHKDN